MVSIDEGFIDQDFEWLLRSSSSVPQCFVSPL